jgi:hypothetical protein
MISLVLLVSALSSPSGHAAEPCLIAGWRGSKTSSGCYAQGFAEASANCASGEKKSAPCNAQWFGTADGATICAEKRADHRWTMSCLQKSATLSRDRLQAKLEQDFQRTDRESSLLGHRIARLEADRKTLSDPKKVALERTTLQAMYDRIAIARAHVSANQKAFEKKKRGLRKRSSKAEREEVQGYENSLAKDRENLEIYREQFVERLLSHGKSTPSEKAEWLERLQNSELTFESDLPKDKAVRAQAEREMMVEPFIREYFARWEKSNLEELAESKRANAEAARTREEADYWRSKLAGADLSIEALLAGGPVVDKVRAFYLMELSQQGRRPAEEWTQLMRTCEDVRNPRDKKDCTHLVKFLGGGNLQVIADTPLPECRSPAAVSTPALPKLLEDFAEAEAYEIRDLIKE